MKANVKKVIDATNAMKLNQCIVGFGAGLDRAREWLKEGDEEKATRELAGIWKNQEVAFVEFDFVRAVFENAPEEWSQARFASDYWEEDEEDETREENETADPEDVIFDFVDDFPMVGFWKFKYDYMIHDEVDVAKLLHCGFAVYHHEDYGYYFGINGCGYDIMDAHWVPLFKTYHKMK